MPRESTIAAQTITEDINTIEEVRGTFVRVTTGVVGQDGKFIVPQTFNIYLIDVENYAELMSESPSWAPRKPSGTYRNDDLWIFIDRIRRSN